MKRSELFVFLTICGSKPNTYRFDIGFEVEYFNSEPSHIRFAYLDTRASVFASMTNLEAGPHFAEIWGI